MITLERPDQLDLDLYRRIVFDGEALAVESVCFPASISGGRRCWPPRAWRRAYGVNTGLGYLADRTVEPVSQAAFQQSILVARASAVGPPLSEPVVRGVMLLRLVGLSPDTPG